MLSTARDRLTNSPPLRCRTRHGVPRNAPTGNRRNWNNASFFGNRSSREYAAFGLSQISLTLSSCHAGWSFICRLKYVQLCANSPVATAPLYLVRYLPRSKSRCHVGPAKKISWLEHPWRIELDRRSARLWDISPVSCRCAAKLTGSVRFLSTCESSTRRRLIRLQTRCLSQSLPER